MNSRLGIRISKEIRAEMEMIVESGNFKNLSELVRHAIKVILIKHRDRQLDAGGSS